MTHSAIIYDGPYRVQAWVFLKDGKWLKIRDLSPVQLVGVPEPMQLRVKNNADIIQ